MLSRFAGNFFWIPAFAGMTGGAQNVIENFLKKQVFIRSGVLSG
jgi:hypothetical protein